MIRLGGRRRIVVLVCAALSSALVGCGNVAAPAGLDDGDGFLVVTEGGTTEDAPAGTAAGSDEPLTGEELQNLGASDPAPGTPGSGDGTVGSSYHQFYVHNGDPEMNWDGATPNGLAVFISGPGVVISTSAWGATHRYEWMSADGPIALQADEWDDVVEVLAEAPTGTLSVEGWAGNGGDERNLAVAGPGTYVVRVYARGRDMSFWDDMPDRSSEEFRVEVWPATNEHPRILKRSAFADSLLAAR